MHPHGHAFDILLHSRHLGNLPGVVEGKVRRGDGDIGIDIPLEQFAGLEDNPDVSAQRLHIQRLDIPAVVIDASLYRLLKAQQKAHQGRFAAAGPSDYRDILPLADFQRQIIQYIGRGFIVAEGHVVQLDRAFQMLDDLLLFLDLRRGLEDRLRHLQRRLDARDRHSRSDQAAEGSGYQAVGSVECNIILGGKASPEGHVIHHYRPA